MATKEEKDLRAVIGDWGLAFELLKVLVHAILKKGGTIENLRRLINEQDLVSKFADMLVDKAVVAFSALVTYLQPSLAALKSAFDWVDDFYAKADFKPIDRCQDVSREQREVGFEYVHLGRDASTDEVLAEMDRQNLRPALYEELLAFGAKYPDEQRQFPIVALGSVCRDSRVCLCVACLGRDGSERNLYLLGRAFGRGWFSRYRFLAVRK